MAMVGLTKKAMLAGLTPLKDISIIMNPIKTMKRLKSIFNGIFWKSTQISLMSIAELQDPSRWQLIMCLYDEGTFL